MKSKNITFCIINGSNMNINEILLKHVRQHYLHMLLTLWRKPINTTNGTQEPRYPLTKNHINLEWSCSLTGFFSSVQITEPCAGVDKPYITAPKTAFVLMNVYPDRAKKLSIGLHQNTCPETSVWSTSAKHSAQIPKKKKKKKKCLLTIINVPGKEKKKNTFITRVGLNVKHAA